MGIEWNGIQGVDKTPGKDWSITVTETPTYRISRMNCIEISFRLSLVQPLNLSEFICMILCI
jgi:hypothetical protein